MWAAGGAFPFEREGVLVAQRRKQVSGSGERGWHCHQRVIRFGTLQRPFLLSRLLLSPLRVQGTSDDRNLRVYLVFFTEKEKNRGPRRLSGCPEVARPVGREFCIGRPDGKSRWWLREGATVPGATIPGGWPSCPSFTHLIWGSVHLVSPHVTLQTLVAGPLCRALNPWAHS